MKRSFLLISIFLFVLTGVANAGTTPSLLLALPDASAPPPISEPSPEEESTVQAELDWRSLAMRDEHGLIPTGALYAANVFRRQQLLNLLPVPIPGIGSFFKVAGDRARSRIYRRRRGPHAVRKTSEAVRGRYSLIRTTLR